MERLEAILSLRLPNSLAGALREIAEEKGLTLSDLLRRQIQEMVGYQIGFRCEHMGIMSSPGVLISASGSCGCEMKKAFDVSDFGMKVPV